MSIVSSLDTLLPGSVPSDLRVRWLRALRQTSRAVGVVEERRRGPRGHAIGAATYPHVIPTNYLSRVSAGRSETLVVNAGDRNAWRLAGGVVIMG